MHTFQNIANLLGKNKFVSLIEGGGPPPGWTLFFQLYQGMDGKCIETFISITQDTTVILKFIQYYIQNEYIAAIYLTNNLYFGHKPYEKIHRIK